MATLSSGDAVIVVDQRLARSVGFEGLENDKKSSSSAKDTDDETSSFRFPDPKEPGVPGVPSVRVVGAGDDELSSSDDEPPPCRALPVPALRIASQTTITPVQSWTGMRLVHFACLFGLALGQISDVFLDGDRSLPERAVVAVVFIGLAVFSGAMSRVPRLMIIDLYGIEQHLFCLLTLAAANASAVWLYQPEAAAALIVTVLASTAPVVVRADTAYLSFFLTVVSFAVAMGLRADYRSVECIRSGRLLIVAHFVHIVVTLLRQLPVESSPRFLHDAYSPRLDFADACVNTEVVDPKAAQALPLKPALSDMRPPPHSRRATCGDKPRLASWAMRGSLQSNQIAAMKSLSRDSSIIRRSWEFVPGDAAEADSAQETPPKPVFRRRLNSGTSDTGSNCSTVQSYVSFAASVVKLPGLTGGYLTHRPDAGDASENANIAEVDELLDAETFNEVRTGSRNYSSTVQAGEDEEKKTGPEVIGFSPDDVIRHDSIVSNTNSNRRMLPFKNMHKHKRHSGRKPTNLPEGSPSASASASRMSISTQRSFALVHLLSKATNTLKDVRKEVRDLMQDSERPIADANGRSSTSPGTAVTFDRIPQTMLQKIMMLISRLSEETDAIRCNYLIVAGICEILHCDRASVFLVEGKTVRTFDEDGTEISVPMDNSLVGYAALNCRVLNIPDAYCDPRFNKEIDKETGYRTRNLLVYPIVRSALKRNRGSSDNKVFAVIEAINKLEGVFTYEDECILSLVGKQAGVLLSNSYFHQQLQNESNKTATLLEVSKEISVVQLDLGKMMEKVMTRARQVLTVERASIFLIDEAKQELWSILTDSEMAAKVGGDNVIRLPVGVGLAGHVARSGETLNIVDAYSSPLFNPAFDRLSGYVTKAALCVPIRVSSKGGRVLGVMQFINKINGNPFHDEDEKLACTFSSFVGISLNNLLLYDELREGQLVREKNKELVRLRDKAKQAAEAKANFLMSMSHEIRTPMSGVIGMTELLENTTLTTEQEEMVSTIRSCGESLLAIINDILDYGRLESGKMELEMAPFDLVALAEDTMDVVRSKVEAKNIAMHLYVSPSLRTHVVGDAFRLRQVLINLLGNAVKFTPEQGEIYMHVRPHEEDEPSPEDHCSVYFGVSDTGIGIPADKHASLFLPFHQASAGTTRQYGGSGLGLSICKQLADVMCGAIGVESSPGNGSCFWITPKFRLLPPPDGAVCVAEKLRSEFLAKKRLSIVVASASVRQRSILDAFFSNFGASVTLFDNTDDVVEYVKSIGTAETGAPPAKETPLGEGEGGVETATKFEGPISITKAIPSIGCKEPTRVSVDVRTVKGVVRAPDLIMVDSSASERSGIDLAAMAAQLEACIGAFPTHICVITMMMHKAAIAQSLGSNASILASPPRHSLLTKLLRRICNKGEAPAKPPVKDAKVHDIPKAVDKKLLVAEDNKTNQLLIKRQLAVFGITPTVCDNGQMVIDTLLVERHDLILMDCHMPVLDGYGASKLIRELEASGKLPRVRIPIIALTADALPHTRGLCLDAGMDDYVTKPLRAQVLRQLLDKWYFNDEDPTTPVAK
ncbi:Histidine kinase 4 [Diplonema papillatum]|nr:Histidine kinase 4 [Diplonema papillatum]